MGLYTESENLVDKQDIYMAYTLGVYMKLDNALYNVIGYHLTFSRNIKGLQIQERQCSQQI